MPTLRVVQWGDTEVSTDGQKVWVNQSGICHERIREGAWGHFRAQVKQHHGVDVPVDFIPPWLANV